MHPPARKMLDIISHYPTAKTSKGKQATAIEIAIRLLMVLSVFIGLGKGRLFLRIALKEKNLQTYLSKLTSDTGLVR